MTKSTNDLLMDTNNFDFIDDNESINDDDNMGLDQESKHSDAVDSDKEEEEQNDEDEDIDDTSFEIDPVSNVPIIRLTKKKSDLPLKNTSTLSSSSHLKFKLGPLNSQNLAFITENSTKSHAYNSILYPIQLPNVDNSKEFPVYVSKLFEIYNDLGDDRVFTIPTFGLIKSSSLKNHNVVVNMAMETMINELEIFINTLQKNYESEKEHQQEEQEQERQQYVEIGSKFFMLEDSLTILNCLKTFHFICDNNNIETNDDEQDFISNDEFDTDSIRNKFITSLLCWINRSDGQPDEAYIEQVFNNNTTGVNEHESKGVFGTIFFWKLLNQLLLRGLFQQAILCIERSNILEYLETQCSSSFQIMKDLISLLENYPTDSYTKFREWKAYTLQLLSNFNDSENKISGELRDSIEDTLLIISGNENKILYYSKTWYESLSGFLLYYIPSLKLIQQYLQLSLERHSLDLTNNWENSCVKIIQNNIHSILPQLESLDSCTAAFTAAICEAKGLLEPFEYTTNDLTDENANEIEDLFSRKNGMASYLINNFALELCSSNDKQLWPIAIGLISLCPQQNGLNNYSIKKLTISELLLHYPFETNDDIEWMLSICAQWKLPRVAKSLYTILGNQMLYQGSTIEAITNFSKAGKFELVKQYSWTLFEASILNNAPLDDQILNAIATYNTTNSNSANKIVSIPNYIIYNLLTSAMRQTLAPYAVLYQFYQARDNQEWAKALRLLISLIEFPYLPKCYLILLVMKFLYPIYLCDDDDSKVKGDDVVFDEFLILNIIESLEDKWDNDDIKSKEFYEKEKTIASTNCPSFPKELHEFNKIVKKRLNFKIYEEFM
ncbi:Nup85p NDAI_0G00420 [Naumovozyma dairenensis CBS 421]|uniref:Nuclear pore complex protein Nup85 n=1 Tax=Naumovozyma dairenensis (strain ATCC 10597 / BCRC 20456 / CBS 421 / NBRC 0211 / NRRL Y-12639) TaxID=1071378 RepID=G0WDF7_NAUDC|nr:hypothetical protein NDAI_0G00420 [Naumovozyma dairenensis CBS 421]CCD25818.2 hypothetical protein NDAI_0G00420 [Naumovozyma dairenensis CBS 421]